MDPTNPGKNTLLTSFAANAAVFGLRDGGMARLSKDFEHKGTSNTIFFMERYSVVGPAGTRHTWNGRDNLENYLYPPTDDLSDPEKMAGPQFDVAPQDARNDVPHSFQEGKTLQVGLADGSARAVTANVLQSFTYAEGRSATAWAWACSLYGPLGKADMPRSGW